MKIPLEFSMLHILNKTLFVYALKIHVDHSFCKFTFFSKFSLNCRSFIISNDMENCLLFWAVQNMCTRICWVHAKYSDSIQMCYQNYRIRASEQGSRARERQKWIERGWTTGNDDCFVLFNKLYCVHNNKQNSLFISARSDTHTYTHHTALHWHRYIGRIYIPKHAHSSTHIHIHTRTNLNWCYLSKAHTICKWWHQCCCEEWKTSPNFVLDRVAGGLETEIYRVRISNTAQHVEYATECVCI